MHNRPPIIFTFFQTDPAWMMRLKELVMIGLRFHASRGSMSLGESKGGLPPDSVVDSEENILSDCIRVIEKYHDPKAGSMLQIVLAPCSPFMFYNRINERQCQTGAHYGVHLHTHLAETEDEERVLPEKNLATNRWIIWNR
jgi:cytosine/adenosine deaminase-related metal-dependent hydrolase